MELASYCHACNLRSSAGAASTAIGRTELPRSGRSGLGLVSGQTTKSQPAIFESEHASILSIVYLFKVGRAPRPHC